MGGVLGLARSLAREVAADGIRVNTLSCSDVLSHGGPGPEAQVSPLGRELRAEDIVEAALFLLSDESSYLVGQDLRVTGGASLW
jgi:NAD(P)-dependent dehydrogenase (short-subunit alcohol dehydrogenase family)